MTFQRRIKLMIGSAVLLALFAFGFYKLFWAPLTALDARRETVQAEYNKQEAELETFYKKRKGLSRYRQLGLPASDSKGVSGGVEGYTPFLTHLLEDSFQQRPDITPPSEMAGKRPSQATASKKAQPGFFVRTWQVHVTSDWKKLVVFLEKFRQAPFLHRIKSLNVEKQAGTTAGKGKGKAKDLLRVDLTIEALVVRDGDKKAGKKARPDYVWSLDKRLALMPPDVPDGRKYRELERWDPFIGGPFPKKPKPAIVPTGPPPRDWLTERQVLEQVRYGGFVARTSAGGPTELDRAGTLVMLAATPDQSALHAVTLLAVRIPSAEQTVWLHNQLLGPDPNKRGAYILLSCKPTANTFEVLDEKGDKPVLKATVLRIEPRDLYFQVDDKIYVIHTGGNLADARDHPLSDEDIDKLGLPKPGPQTLEKAGNGGKMETSDSGLR